MATYRDAGISITLLIGRSYVLHSAWYHLFLMRELLFPAERVIISCRESYCFLPREFLLSREETKKVALYNGYKATLLISLSCSA